MVIATLILAFNSPSRSGPNYSELASTCLGNKGRMSHVVAACTTLLKVEEVTPAQQNRLLRARGWAYYCGKHYDEAISDYTSALALQPDNANTLTRRGVAQDALGDVQAAEADFVKAVQMNPESTYALFSKAKFDQRQGDVSGAIQGYELVLEIDPGNSKAGFNLVNAHSDLAGVDGVERAIQQAKQSWPEETWVYDAQWMFDLKYTGDPESALAATSAAARLKPGRYYESSIPAMIHLMIGDEERGIEYVEAAAARIVAEEDSNTIFFKRWFYDAIGWYLWRNNEELLYRGDHYAILGREDLARIEFEKAFDGLSRAGRKAILDMFRKKGVSVPNQAYAGSTEHINKAILDYTKQAGNAADEFAYVGSSSVTYE
ncbi:tetratricopeptide repeat protein [Ruegeria sp.]|uniref:tetratricopeptide repeat protein n=1 Tax=Ruegeria sp. TaxID=1879320 RepID=UPI003B5B9378